MKTFIIIPIHYSRQAKAIASMMSWLVKRKKIFTIKNGNKMELTGRLTKDAAVKTTKSGKEFIAFSIAQNDTYKAKGSNEITRVVTYFDCAYWRGSNIAPFMTKGTIVELSGRIGVNAWNNKDGAARAQLTCHVSTIKLLRGGGKTAEAVPEAPPQSPKGRKAQNAEPQPATTDDLPF